MSREGDSRDPQYFKNSANDPVPYSELTLRDYFAAKAMLGILFNLPQIAAPTNGRTATENIVTDAYRIADAMLKERAK